MSQADGNQPSQMEQEYTLLEQEIDALTKNFYDLRERLDTVIVKYPDKSISAESEKKPDQPMAEWPMNLRLLRVKLIDLKKILGEIRRNLAI